MRIRRVRRATPKLKTRPKPKPKAPVPTGPGKFVKGPGLKPSPGGAGIPMPYKKPTIAPRKPLTPGGGPAPKSVAKPKPKVRRKPTVRKATTKTSRRRRAY